VAPQLKSQAGFDASGLLQKYSIPNTAILSLLSVLLRLPQNGRERRACYSSLPEGAAPPPRTRSFWARPGAGSTGIGLTKGKAVGIEVAHDKIDIPPAPLRNQLDLRCGGPFGRGRS
jgi:hypothetical protein